MTEITVFHNPACGTSRQVLALMRTHGVEPRIVEYLKTPPTRAELAALVAATGQSPRALLRAKEALCAELGLGQPGRTDDDLLDAMATHPRLINRPLVVTPRATRLCRPAAVVLDLLPPPDPPGAVVATPGAPHASGSCG